MTPQPYQWSHVGNCPTCGAPIYGRIKELRPHFGKRAAELDLDAEEHPQAWRTCPVTCPYTQLATSEALTERA